ncbi:hypothetical protein WAK64_10975 [Bacillus spongiae]|uniref:Uncharacterized protein n=1 Tax=Bacillus spongiae TaxID=2683610 RepID=A0ABU8HDZ2_9BACI
MNNRLKSIYTILMYAYFNLISINSNGWTDRGIIGKAMTGHRFLSV